MRVNWFHDEDGGVSIAEVGFAHNSEDEAVKEQFEILMEALKVYAERNKKYRDNWKRMGWRGQLVRVRERAERLWDEFWNKPSVPLVIGEYDVDDAIDLINFVGFLIRAIRAENRDGTWW